MIMVIFILPMITAALYFMGLNPEHLKTTNVGILLNPPIQKSDWVQIQPSTHPRWQLVYVHPEACDNSCEQALARLNSIHQALFKDIPRIEVALWTQKNVSLNLANIKVEQLLTAEQPCYVIADPLGNIMLKYPLTADTSGILRDLKQLLKVSQIG
jgi:hypothetical protein